jgi:hypothetical protein
VLTGSQVARFNTSPSPRGYSITHATAALQLAEGYGLVADPWQADIVRSWLRTDRLGMWCASTWGASAPRQNGKNGALEIVELYLMVELNLKILHTSHLLGSARKAFKRLMYFFGTKKEDPHAKFPELNALVLEIRKTNGQEAIELIDGGLIELGARTGGAGRGSSFDVLVVDEAQEYEEDEQEALKPTISAAPSGDPVTIFMGTPPRDLSERGEPFVRVRNSAVSGANKRSAWVEHSASGDVDEMDEPTLKDFVSDRRHWAEANPALGRRVSAATIESELHEFSPRSFARERLNMWPTPREAGKLAFNAVKWKDLAVHSVPDDLQIAAIGIDMNVEQTKVSVSISVFNGPAKIHLELIANAPFDAEGASTLIEWIWEKAKRRVPVVLDAFSPARDILEVPMKKRGLTVYILDAREFTQACAMLLRAVDVEKSVTHLDHPDQERLDESIKHTVKEGIRNRPGSFRWNRDSLDADLGPVMSVTCAHFGALKFARRRSTSERKKRHAIVG